MTITRRAAFAAPMIFAPLTALARPIRHAYPTTPKATDSRWITNRQAGAIRLAMAERSGWFRLGRHGRGTIRRAICDAFAVPALGELPKARFEDVIRFIRAWTPPVHTDPAVRACRHWRNYHTALWRALDHMHEYPPTPGYDVDNHFVRHHDRDFELLMIALHTPATTVAGLHAKLLMYRENYGHGAEPGTPRWEEAQADPEYSAMAAITADAERLAV